MRIYFSSYRLKTVWKMTVSPFHSLHGKMIAWLTKGRLKRETKKDPKQAKPVLDPQSIWYQPLIAKAGLTFLPSSTAASTMASKRASSPSMVILPVM